MQDEDFMREALELARNAEGRTSPNPMVGAVIVQGGRIVAAGWHRKAGTPHAEIHALRMAGELAKGATLYVTLEPCSHYGRTGPCAKAVVEAGIKRCVIAMKDPNPLVAGRASRYSKMLASKRSAASSRRRRDGSTRYSSSGCLRRCRSSRSRRR